jgi:hypothetical protein
MLFGSDCNNNTLWDVTRGKRGDTVGLRGDDAEGVLLSLRAKGVPPDAMTQVLEQLDQAGTPIIQQE